MILDPVIGVVSAAQLRQLARGGTDSTLERAVLAGQGHRLLAEAESLSLSHHISTLVAKCDALHSAVERGSLLQIQELLENEYNRRKYVTCRDEAGVGLLHKAVFHDFMDIVKYLVKNYPQLVHQKDSEGRTALHYVAVCRDEAVAAALLEGAGASRGARDASGRTPGNYRGAGRTLLALPTTDDMARENAKNTPGLVIKRHNIRIWCHDCDMARLQRVVWEGHGARLLSEVSNQPVVKRFLEAVPYIMNTIRDIHNAVVHNNLEDVMKLSSDPVPPQILSSRDSYNMTVMHKAAGLGHVSIMKYIAERYPQGINDVDNDGRTPLHYAAAMRDDQHTYNTLVGLGADESAIDNKNRTPGYYINRSQEIDKNGLKTVPDAPRTASSAYPTTWDWKLLDNDIIVDLNKKTRRRNLKASTENLSSKNNTNTLSENTESLTNAIKTSSTHELIKNLPELDDNNKLNNDDADNSHEPETGDNNEEPNIETETKSMEEEHDDNQDDSHDNKQDDHQDDNHEKNQDETNYENHDSDKNHMENNDNHDEHPHLNQDEDKGENYNQNHHADQKHLEYESLNYDKDLNLIKNEGEDNSESNHLNKHEDESKTENQDENDESKDSVTKQLELQAEELSIEPETTETPDQGNVEFMILTTENGSKDIENSEINNELTEDPSINIQEKLDDEQVISSNESPAGNNEIVEEAEEATTLKEITGDKHEEILAIEDINRKSATSGNFNNGRNSQESLLEGIINSDAEQDLQDASVTQTEGLPSREVFIFDNEIDPEVTDLINNANMEMLATLVLNGEGSRLIGRESRNTELQAFLDNVPTYMQKINKVHLAAKEGNIKDLQAALDRRKFAIARDPISPNGTTPLHVATTFGKTNIIKYLGGRFPETLSAVDFEGRTALHYAAVLPDNGHYYNLLQQLGANSKDLDDNGRSAEDYYKNPCLLPFDQLLSDFGISEDVVKNMFSDKAPSHGGNGHMDIPIFRTEEGRYLAQSLGDPLIKGLTEVANVKPKDPVAFLASFLQKFPNSEKPVFDIEDSNMTEALEETELESQMQTKEVIPTEVIPNVRRSAARTATRSHRPIDVITVDPQPIISPDAPEIAFSSANRDEHGQSMLHFAAARTHARNALFQLLQESEISLGYRDELYRTARDVSIQANVPENTAEIDKWVLHLAAKGNTEKIMNLLLEGYDHIVDLVDENGMSIIEVVAERGETDMSNLLTSISAFEESRENLHAAVRRGDLPAVQEILSAANGRSVARSQNSYGRTALHIAILAQNEDIVAYLAQSYPELLRMGDNLERTSLHYAMGVEKIESLSRILIRAGAKRVLKDLKGRQASYYFMNKSDILRLKEEEEAY